jgi:hypothetical protein
MRYMAKKTNRNEHQIYLYERIGFAKKITTRQLELGT